MNVKQYLVLLAVCGVIGSCDEGAKPQDEKAASPQAANHWFTNTTWYSRELQYSYKPEIPNNINLKFTGDSVDFNMPAADGMLVAEVLKERYSALHPTPTHFVWKILLTEKKSF